jgi:hypothetical protein
MSNRTIARYWGLLHKHATTPIPKFPKSQRSRVSPKAAPNPLKPPPPLYALRTSKKNSRLQSLFPRALPTLRLRATPAYDPLALGSFRTSSLQPPPSNHLAQADHMSRDRRHAALELEPRPLFVPQSRTGRADLPRGSSPQFTAPSKADIARAAGVPFRHEAIKTVHPSGACSTIHPATGGCEERLCQTPLGAHSLTLARHPRSLISASLILRGTWPGDSSILHTRHISRRA